MPTTLAQMVDRVRGHLDQFTTNRPQKGTFTGWVGVTPFTGIGLSGMRTNLTEAVVELGHELVHVTSHDPATLATLCPPWFRQQQGTAANDAYPVNSVAVVNPRWPYWHVASAINDAIAALYPSLFAVETVELTSLTFPEKYLIPDDVERVLRITVEWMAPTYAQREISRWTFDAHPSDGNRYLHVPSVGYSGRPMFLTYAKRPTLFDLTAPSVDWSATGLSVSAVDLPILHAVSHLLPTAEAAKTQTASVEQSDRSRLVQAGSATAASRRFREMFETRLTEERRALLDQHPPRWHKQLNG